MVTADGEKGAGQAEEQPDLFWALRGAGANFGVVTSVGVPSPSGRAYRDGGMVVHPLENAPKVLRFHRELSLAQPDDDNYAALLTTPDGAQVVALVCCYAGSPEEGERVVAPLRQSGHVADMTGRCPTWQCQDDRRGLQPVGSTTGSRACSGNRRRDYRGAGGLASRVPSPLTTIAIADTHGAYGRVASDATAYAHRDLPFDLVILSSWTDPAETEPNITWTRALYDAVRPYTGDRVYVNDLDRDEGQERVGKRMVPTSRGSLR